jgi:hypothetical protein
MLSDQVNIQLKRGVKIITCDPSTRTIEAETRNGEVISVNAYYYSPVFRWPVSGEKWVVREENGSWFLEGLYEEQQKGTLASARPAFTGNFVSATAEPGDLILSIPTGRVLFNIEGQLFRFETPV